MIYIKRLSYEERATWATCPICEAIHGEPCAVLTNDMAGYYKSDDDMGPGVHAARLVNAPKVAAVNDNDEQQESA
jgi:hypothetical protein